MNKTQTITASIDEMACLLTRLLAVALEQGETRLNYGDLKEIHRRLIIDLKSTDFTLVKKEFNELLSIYKMVADELQNTEPAKEK
jgi:hypothetical protein